MAYYLMWPERTRGAAARWFWPGGRKGGSMSVIRVLCVLLMASALVSGLPRAATACALDNRASLYADGVPALLAASGPHGRGPWAE